MEAKNVLAALKGKGFESAQEAAQAVFDLVFDGKLTVRLVNRPLGCPCCSATHYEVTEKEEVVP